MASPKFWFERGDIQQKMYSLNSFEKFKTNYKKFAQNFKNSPKFSKIKFNSILNNFQILIKFKKIC